MIRFFKTLSVILLLVWGGVPFSFAQGVPSVTVEETETDIILRAENAPLGEVLQAISEKTGIRFVISESVMSDPVTVDYVVTDWQTGVELLLESYDQLALWTDQLDSSKVHVLARTAGGPPAALVPGAIAGAPRTPAPSTLGNVPSALDPGTLPTSMELTRDQLKEIARGKLKSPLSPHLLRTPAIANFLKQFDIASIQDSQDTLKAMRARVQARRMLKKKR